MTNKFQNKYRIPSARLKNWDYGANGGYFLTICTQNRKHFFGKIIEKQFIASEIGTLAEKFWMEIPQHFPYIELGNFVVMPNHVHGILIIDKNGDSDIRESVDGESVETRLIASLPPTNPLPPPQIGGVTGENNPMIQDNISRIIRWYKGRCSFEMRKIRADFGWQPRFHDHIIRNAPEWERIQTYIENNPMNWKEDKFYLV